MAASRGRWVLWHGRCWFSQTESAVPSQAPDSLYPPIVASFTAKSKAAKRRRLEHFHQRVHAAASIEEKLRLYGQLQRPKYMLYPQTFALNADRWYRSFTKTVFVPGLPPRAVSAAAKAPRAVVPEAAKIWGGAAGVAPGAAEALEPGTAVPGAAKTPEVAAGGAPYLDVGELRSLVCDALLQESFYQNKKRPFLYRHQDHTPGPFLTQLVSTLAAFLSSRNPLLAASSLDLKPEVNYYWHHGEEVVVHGHRKGRVDPVRFQIDDKPHLQIRVPKQLPEVWIFSTASQSHAFSLIGYSPTDLIFFSFLGDTGSKVPDPCCYGHTQFHLIPDKLKRERFIRANLEDQIEVVYRANGIASLFAWTAAQAMYQGFWNEADVTRPFVSQAVVTDGKYFAFFSYQLNTLALTVETIRNNPRKNICWGTDSKPLYDVVEGDSVKGFNDEVLLQLVRFLLNRPKEL
ncbi:RT30 protein, partial [Corythaeola cristata]|nr:RT30 protein [Corythaeola cristata]